MSSRLSWGLRWRLSVLWALQWGITGAILTYMPIFFDDLGLDVERQSQLLAISAVGLWVAPFVVGQICDRWLSSEKYLAIAHFVGGLTLVAFSIAADVFKEGGDNFTTLIVLLGLYAIAYFPTIPLASSLSFRQLPDPDVQFGKVRIWGTVGWVLAGMLLSVWLGRKEAYVWLAETYPAIEPTLRELRAALWWVNEPRSSDCFRIAALLSFTLSTFCIFLPSTPPTKSKRGAIAPLQTFSMFRDRTFSMLIAVTFLLAMFVPFYTFGVPKLLEQSQFGEKWVPAVMTIGQISEFPALLLLAFCLKRFGLKATFALGMAAWVIRFAMFAVDGPVWLMLSGIALHGVCHVFLIIVIQLYVDSKCRRDLRASAQNLFAFLTMGIAMPAGFLLAGKIAKWCFDEGLKTTNYQVFFSVPAAAVFVLLVAFWRWFGSERLLSSQEKTASSEPPAETVAGDPHPAGGE